MSGPFTRDVLVPGWIVSFGFASLTAPPASVVASLALFIVGVVVIPGLVLLKIAQRVSRAETTAEANNL